MTQLAQTTLATQFRQGLVSASDLVHLIEANVLTPDEVRAIVGVDVKQEEKAA